MSETICSKTLWHGLEAYSLRNATYEAIILPDYGANCISLCHLPLHMECLRTPSGPDALAASAYVYGLPILFPPNRIYGGRFCFHGSIYDFPINDSVRNSHIHGFLAKTPFRHTQDGTFVFEATKKEPYLTFPHTFRMERIYDLTENGLHHQIRITNTSPAPMPLAIGIHAAWNLPSANSRLKLPAIRQILLDRDTFIPTGETLADAALVRNLCTGTLQPELQSLSHLLEVESGDWTLQTESALLRFSPDPAFRFAMLWNQGGNRGFVCPEPQTCTVNAFRHSQSAEQTGISVLPPGGEATFSMRLSVEVR